MTTTTSAQNGGYLLGTDEQERARLLAQSEIYRPATESLLHRIGVAEGWTALDIGCGPLGVLDSLADRVGATGTVVGLDREPRMLKLAAVWLTRLGHTGVELAHGEAATTGLAADAFDLVHERLLLAHAPDPVAIVTEMVRLARPDGYVVLRDIDAISWTPHPPHPAWDRLMRALITSWSGDWFIGRRLPSMLREAGLVDIGVDACIQVWQPGDLHHKLLLHFADICREQVLATGALTEAQLDEYVRELDAHLDHPDTVTLYIPLIQAWGRKP